MDLDNVQICCTHCGSTNYALGQNNVWCVCKNCGNTFETPQQILLHKRYPIGLRIAMFLMGLFIAMIGLVLLDGAAVIGIPAILIGIGVFALGFLKDKSYNKAYEAAEIMQKFNEKR